MQAAPLLIVAALTITLPHSGRPPPPPAQNAERSFAGSWTVRFANGVVESCTIKDDDTVSVSEPKRSATGKAETKDGVMTIQFKDDRVERWTAIGKRMVVEHWFPAAMYPDGPRVLGIAERCPKPSADSVVDAVFKIEAKLHRGGPRLTVQVVPQPAKSSWHYDLHITTSEGLDQHFPIRNGQPLTPRDVQLVDVTSDGFLDILIVGGKDAEGKEWFKTWLFDTKTKKYRWINDR